MPQMHAIFNIIVFFRADSLFCLFSEVIGEVLSYLSMDKFWQN